MSGLGGGRKGRGEGGMNESEVGDGGCDWVNELGGMEGGKGKDGNGVRERRG